MDGIFAENLRQMLKAATPPKNDRPGSARQKMWLGGQAGADAYLPRPRLGGRLQKLSDTQVNRLITGKILTGDAHYRDHFMPGGNRIATRSWPA